MYNKYESFRIVPHYVIEVDELRKRLNQYSSGSHSASEDIANWAGAGFLYFMEEAEYETPESEFLCDILGDIEAQWEILTANAFDQGGKEAVYFAAFPEHYISEWIAETDSFIAEKECRPKVPE